MSVTQDITDKLTARFDPSLLEVIDESRKHRHHEHRQGHHHDHDPAGHRKGGETHFRVRIATRHFDGLSRLAQHRLVMETLDDEIKAGVHALAIEVVQS
jgi:BolA family transcriptional regulator, general stress-responsive regulator